MKNHGVISATFERLLWFYSSLLNRIHNKSVYFKMGLRKMVNQTKCKDLHQNVLIEVDGRQLDLPPIEGIIILNILSWGAGANPWGVEKDEAFAKPTHYDGLLEVVGVTGVVHMGQIFSGLRTGTRLAQGGHVSIHFSFIHSLWCSLNCIMLSSIS